jgi:hypothetical protein
MQPKHYTENVVIVKACRWMKVQHIHLGKYALNDVGVALKVE